MEEVSDAWDACNAKSWMGRRIAGKLHLSRDDDYRHVVLNRYRSAMARRSQRDRVRIGLRYQLLTVTSQWMWIPNLIVSTGKASSSCDFASSWAGDTDLHAQMECSSLLFEGGNLERR